MKVAIPIKTKYFSDAEVVFTSESLSELILTDFYHELSCHKDENALLIENRKFITNYLFSLQISPDSIHHIHFIELANTHYIALTLKINNEFGSIAKFENYQDVYAFDECLVSTSIEDFKPSLYNILDLYFKTADLEKTTFQDFVEAESFEVKAKEFLSSSSNSN